MALVGPAIEDVEISRTVELLGGRRILHRPIRSRLEAHDLLQKGLPGHALKHLVNYVAILRAPHHGSLEKAVGISLRTYQPKSGSWLIASVGRIVGTVWDGANCCGAFASPCG